MPNLINQIVCPSDKANTGRGPCAAPKAPVNWKIAIPFAKTFTETDLADVAGMFKTGLVANNRAQRIYAIGELTDVDPQVAEEVVNTAGGGGRFIPKRASVNYSYQMMGATDCDQRMLAAFEGSQTRYAFLDYQVNEWLIGQKVINSALPNARELGGYHPQLVHVPMQKDATYADVAMSYIQFNHINPFREQLNIAAVNVAGLDLETIFRTYAVSTVELQQASAVATAGVYPVFAIAGCGQNLGVDYATTLTAACFKLSTTAGVDIPIASISVNSVTGAIAITATTPPASGVVVRVSMGTVSAVFAIIGGYFEVVTPLSITSF